MISVLLLRDLHGSAKDMRVFSLRHSWQDLVFLL